jgi:hypothetical protein
LNENFSDLDRIKIFLLLTGAKVVFPGLKFNPSDYVALSRLMFRNSGGNSSFDYGRLLRFQTPLNQLILSSNQKQNFFLSFT